MNPVRITFPHSPVFGGMRLLAFPETGQFKIEVFNASSPLLDADEVSLNNRKLGKSPLVGALSRLLTPETAEALRSITPGVLQKVFEKDLDTSAFLKRGWFKTSEAPVAVEYRMHRPIFQKMVEHDQFIRQTQDIPPCHTSGTVLLEMDKTFDLYPPLNR